MSEPKNFYGDEEFIKLVNSEKYRDYKHVKQYTYEKSYERAYEDCIKLGREKQLKKQIQNGLNKNYSPNTISEVIGLTLEKVQDFIEEHKLETQ